MKLLTRLFVAAALLTTGSLALAQPGHGDHDRRGQGHGQHDSYRASRHDGRRHDRPRHHESGHDVRRAYGGHGYSRHDTRRYDYRHHDYRQSRPHYRHARWVRGHRYYGPSYVVRDYGYYRLRPPPYGYHWVRADNDFLLVAITTGIILDLALR